MIKPSSEKAWGTHWMHRNDPVLELNFRNMTDYPNGDRLPSIMITEPIFDDEGGYDGRTYMMIYPYLDHEFPFPGHDDEDGEDALYFGGCYYDEGMGYTDPDERDKRVGCFRAAEILYRHSAGKGNAVANLCLGYVYSYDRCEGNYWVDSGSLETGEGYPVNSVTLETGKSYWVDLGSLGTEEGYWVDPMMLNAEEGCKHHYPREERAFECFKVAAEAGIPEGCYKLGDMYKHGIGCEADAVSAYSWYARASELALKGEAPVILGSIALRLAGCYEEGFGCEQSFSRALQWYRQAISALGAAVEGGEIWYEKALAGARAGEKRCLQEVTC